MPFVKRAVPAPSPAGRRAGDDVAPHNDGLEPHIAALRSPDIEVRWKAARALGGRADAVPALAPDTRSDTAGEWRNKSQSHAAISFAVSLLVKSGYG